MTTIKNRAMVFQFRSNLKILLIIILTVCASCNGKRERVSNKGTIELIYFPGSAHEKHFFFNKTEAISRIINNDSTTVIFFHDHFVNQLDSMNYLAASYFKLKFFDVNGVEEINLDSFSSVASLRMPKIKKPVIYYDKENGTYFTNNRIEIKTTAAQ